MFFSIFLVFSRNRLGGNSFFALSLFSSPFSSVFESSILPRIHHSSVTLYWLVCARAPTLFGDGHRTVTTPLGKQDSSFHFAFPHLHGFRILLALLCLSMPKYFLDTIIHAFWVVNACFYTYAMPPHAHAMSYMPFDMMNVSFHHHVDNTCTCHAHALCLDVWLLACHHFLSLSPSCICHA